MAAMGDLRRNAYLGLSLLMIGATISWLAVAYQVSDEAEQREFWSLADRWPALIPGAIGAFLFVALLADVRLPVLGVPLQPPPPENRIFLSQTVDALKGLMEPHLEVHRENVLAPYVGQWMRVTGQVFDLAGDDAVMLKHGQTLTGLVVCQFDKNWQQRLHVLAKDSTITVVGKVGYFRAAGGVRLTNCEIES